MRGRHRQLCKVRWRWDGSSVTDWGKYILLEISCFKVGQLILFHTVWQCYMLCILYWLDISFFFLWLHHPIQWKYSRNILDVLCMILYAFPQNVAWHIWHLWKLISSFFLQKLSNFISPVSLYFFTFLPSPLRLVVCNFYIGLVFWCHIPFDPLVFGRHQRTSSL